MVSAEQLGILRKIHARLNGAHVNWRLTGSLAFALQDVPVLVHDIDILQAHIQYLQAAKARE